MCRLKSEKWKKNVFLGQKNNSVCWANFFFFGVLQLFPKFSWNPPQHSFLSLFLDLRVSLVSTMTVLWGECHASPTHDILMTYSWHTHDILMTLPSGDELPCSGPIQWARGDVGLKSPPPPRAPGLWRAASGARRLRGGKPSACRAPRQLCTLLLWPVDLQRRAP